MHTWVSIEERIIRMNSSIQCKEKEQHYIKASVKIEIELKIIDDQQCH